MGTTLIARIIAEGGGAEYRKALTYEKADIFLLPDTLFESIDYNPGVALEDNEWFGLAGFSNKPYCPPFLLRTNFSSANYDAIKSTDFGNITFLCGYQNGHYFFQRVTPARQVNQKRLFFGEYCKYEENSASISINEYADAIYSPFEDKLYFQKLQSISQIFDGINELYREATEGEVNYFLQSDFIELQGGFSCNNVKINNRKRIALALETLRHFSAAEQHTVFEYVKDYCPELTNGNNRFAIHNEDSLKRLLFGIEQRYYTTPVGGERRMANSVIVLN